jgi:hypothetical protein
MAYINNFDLFNIEEVTIAIPFIGNVTYSKAKPAGSSSLINVLKSFPWKISGDTDEVPSVMVKEYELTWGQTITNIQRAMQLKNELFATDKSMDPYLTMYSGNPTGFNYVFPHLIKNNDSLRSISNRWDKEADTTMKGVTEGLMGLADGVAGAINPLQYIPIAGGAIKNVQDAVMGKNIVSNLFTGVGAEEVKKFGGSGAETLTISFPLYNTIDTASAYKNYSLVTLLTFQNLKTRTTFMSYVPPKLYRVENVYQGGIYMPVAFISKLDIKSIGTTRVLKEYGNILIPEGYSVSITFQSLLSQSSNIFEGTMGGSKIDVIEESDIVGRDVITGLQSLKDKGIDIFGAGGATNPAVPTPGDATGSMASGQYNPSLQP